MEVPSFVLERVMNKLDTVEGDIVWWAPVLGGGEGYVILWENGDYHHTYRNPEDYL
jgi:hypothetical protein